MKKAASIPQFHTLVITLVTVVAMGVVPPYAAAQVAGHSNDLPPLTPDTHFPRCTYSELTGVGYPDHMHAWNWPGWRPLADEEGNTYGPGSFCEGAEVLPRQGLVLGEGIQRLGHFAIQYNSAYKDCDILYFLEILDWAGRTVPGLLGLALQDTLHVISPDSIESYLEMTGYGVWRHYKLEGDRCISEPLPVLQARTLDGHALFSLVTEWMLSKAIPTDLPPWLRCGLAEYISEDGVHLVNYMAQFRSAGPILFSPPLIDSILGAGPNPDREKDREMFRRASYSAFLMVWELVENQGGLPAMRDFLGHLAGGLTLDEASKLVYGVNLQDLVALLDPAGLGEPIGKAVQSRSPHRPPE